MRIFLILITSSSLLLSCSPQKRLARLVALHPELIHQDTIIRIDTTVVSGVVHDTIFRTQITKDTITIIDKQMTIKYYNDGKHTYLKGKCDTVWVIKKIPVQVNTVSPTKVLYETHWWDWLARAIALLAILFIIFDQLAIREK